MHEHNADPNKKRKAESDKSPEIHKLNPEDEVVPSNEGEQNAETSTNEENSDNIFERMESMRPDTNYQSLVIERAKLQMNIEVVEAQIVDLKKHKKILRFEVKNQRFYDKVKEGQKLTPEVRENKKIKILDINNKLTLLREEKADLKRKFRTLNKRIKQALRNQGLRYKAESRVYTTQNANHIRYMLLKFLRELSSTQKDRLAELKAEADEKKFVEAFKELADELNPEVYVMISGLADLKLQYFQIIRDTLDNWDAEGGDMISELVINS